MAEDVAEILAQVSRTYAELNSYSDRGYVLSRKSPDEPFEKEKTFSTFFKRPNYFRFEWFNVGERDIRMGKSEIPNIIWCDGKNSYGTFSYNRKIERMKSLSSAVASAAGISSGLTPTISTLLMDEIYGCQLTKATTLVLGGDERLTDQENFQLVSANGEVTYYVDKTQNTLRKVDRDMIVDSRAMEAKLRTKRFKTIDGLACWLIYKLATRSAPRVVIRLIQSSVYEEVNLNPNLLDEIFSEAGPAAHSS